MLCDQSKGLYKLQRFDCVPGRELSPGDKSVTGVYAIVSTDSGILLRAPIIQGVAELYRDTSRAIHEAFLIPL